MKLQFVAVVFSNLLLALTLAQQLANNTLLPLCDSKEAEDAAQVALNFINGQHSHGYKYTLNRIEDIKIHPKGKKQGKESCMILNITTSRQAFPDGSETYLMELEFLETKCHVLDPTPVPQCIVRPKNETAVEADCDVALSKVAGVLSVVAFKCKTETESAEDMCVGCPQLIPFNDTNAAQLLKTSLDTFNEKHTLNAMFTLLEVGRLSSQVVSGGPKIIAEYAIIETNCTSVVDDICVPLNHTVARHGFCLSEGVGPLPLVDCTIFLPLIPVLDAVNVTVPASPPVLLHAHTAGPGYNPTVHGLRHHKLTTLHDPDVTGLLSAESAESAEVLPSVAAPAPIVKREVAPPLPLVPRCPGKKRHF